MRERIVISAIVGNGTEYPRLETFMLERKPKSVSLFKHLPKEDYDPACQSLRCGVDFLGLSFYHSQLSQPVIALLDGA